MHVCVNQSIWCPTVFPLHPLSYDLFHSCESKCHLQAEYFQMHVYSSDAFSEFHPDIPHSFLEISFLCLKISRWKNWKLYFWLLSTPIHTQSQVLKCISLAFFFPFHLMDPLYTLCLSLPLSLPRQETRPPVILFSTSFPTSNTHLVLEVSSTSWNKRFPCRSVGKESAYTAGDLGSIPGSGRSPGEGTGNSLQYSCLENPMDRGAW